MENIKSIKECIATTRLHGTPECFMGKTLPWQQESNEAWRSQGKTHPFSFPGLEFCQKPVTRYIKVLSTDVIEWIEWGIKASGVCCSGKIISKDVIMMVWWREVNVTGLKSIIFLERNVLKRVLFLLYHNNSPTHRRLIYLFIAQFHFVSRPQNKSVRPLFFFVERFCLNSSALKIPTGIGDSFHKMLSKRPLKHHQWSHIFTCLKIITPAHNVPITTRLWERDIFGEFMSTYL